MISVSDRPSSRKRRRSVVADRRRVVDDPLGQIHHRDVDLVEAGGTMVERDREHRLAELLLQDGPVRQTAVART